MTYEGKPLNANQGVLWNGTYWADGYITNPNISTTAAIAVSKLAAGTSAQILLNNATPTPTWTTVSGDISISNSGVTTLVNIDGYTLPNPGNHTGFLYSSGSALSWNQFSGDVTNSVGAITVVALQGNAVQSGTNGAAQDGYVLTWHNASSQFQVLPAAGGSSVTFASDLSGNGTSTTTNQYVSSLSYSSASAGGTIAIKGTATALQVAANNTAFSLNQATPTSDVLPSNITITSQAPYASSTTTANKTSGHIVLNVAGQINGLSSSLTNSGYIDFQLGGTSYGGFQVFSVDNPGGTIGSGATAVSYLFLGAPPISSTQSGSWTSKPFIAGSGSSIYIGNSATNFITYNGTTLTGSFGVTATGGINTNGSSSNTFGSGASGVGVGIGKTLSGSVSGSSMYFPNQSTGSSVSMVYANSQTKTASYTLLANNAGNNDHIIYVDTATAAAATTMTLPSAANSGNVLGLTYIIKDSTGSAATYNITISGNGKNIDGASTYVLNLNYASVTLQYNGTQWNVISSYNGTVI